MTLWAISNLHVLVQSSGKPSLGRLQEYDGFREATVSFDTSQFMIAEHSIDLRGYGMFISYWMTTLPPSTS